MLFEKCSSELRMILVGVVFITLMMAISHIIGNTAAGLDVETGTETSSTDSGASSWKHDPYTEVSAARNNMNKMIGNMLSIISKIGVFVGIGMVMVGVIGFVRKMTGIGVEEETKNDIVEVVPIIKTNDYEDPHTVETITEVPLVYHDVKKIADSTPEAKSEPVTNEMLADKLDSLADEVAELSQKVNSKDDADYECPYCGQHFVADGYKGAIPSCPNCGSVMIKVK